MAEATNVSSPTTTSGIRSPSLKIQEPSSSPSSAVKLRRRTTSTNSTNSNGSSGEASCAICLGKLENKSYTNSCLHQFCFACLLEWSKVKAECPLCKQKFKSIIHNVRSLQEFDEYHVRNIPEETNADLLSRFRYRSTLTPERRRELAFRRAVDANIIPSYPYRHPRRRTATSEFRRSIYEDDIWARPLADITGRYRETDPGFYRENPAVTHRLIPWLNRELNALIGRQPRRRRTWDVSHVLQTVMDLITSYSMTSPQFAAAVRPYLGHYTDHFVHEFYNFARSPLDMIGYDTEVDYGPHGTLPALENPPRQPEVHLNDTSDSEDSDIVFMGRHTPPTGLDMRSRLFRTMNPSFNTRREPTTAEVDFSNILRFLNDHHPYAPPCPSRNVTQSPETSSADAGLAPRISKVTTQSPQPGPSGLQRFSPSRRSTPALDSDADSEDIEVIDIFKSKPQQTPELVTLSDSDEAFGGETPFRPEAGPSTSSAINVPQSVPSASTSRVTEASSSISSSSPMRSRYRSKQKDQPRQLSEDRRGKRDKKQLRPKSTSPETSDHRGKAWRPKFTPPSERPVDKKSEKAEKVKSKEVKEKSSKLSKKSRKAPSRSPVPKKRRHMPEGSSSSSEEAETKTRSVKKMVTLPRYWDLTEPSTSSSSSSSHRDTYAIKSKGKQHKDGAKRFR